MSERKPHADEWAIHNCYFYSMTKSVVDNAEGNMLYYLRFHDEEGLSKANVIKAT
jgi:hypothetical protein